MNKELFKQDKPWFKSKTIRVNAMLLLGGILLGLADQYQTAGVLTTSAILNIVLRAVTSDKIRW